jgi:hypothetical protein
MLTLPLLHLLHCTCILCVCVCVCVCARACVHVCVRVSCLRELQVPRPQKGPITALISWDTCLATSKFGIPIWHHFTLGQFLAPPEPSYSQPWSGLAATWQCIFGTATGYGNRNSVLDLSNDFERLYTSYNPNDPRHDNL